jgi:molybdate transport system substrate-binding protein
MPTGQQVRFAPLGAAILVIALGLAWTLRPNAAAVASQDITVFAAASLGDVMKEVGSAYAQEHVTPHKVYFNIAASNVLAQQILASSEADLFLSANEQWMDEVETAGRLVGETRKPFLSNSLSIIAHAESDWQIHEASDLARLPFRHLAVGNPQAVPAGRYAKAFLEATPHQDGTLWAALSDKVVPTLDVRAALALVEADSSIIGIVYRTDAAASQYVRVLLEIPDDAAPPIHYFAARVDRDAAQANSQRFFDFLFSASAQTIFARHGFIPAEQKEAEK